MDPRVESRRVPRAVHKVALSILDNVENRMIKSWLPRDAEGAVYFDQSLEENKTAFETIKVIYGHFSYWWSNNYPNTKIPEIDKGSIIDGN